MEIIERQVREEDFRTRYESHIPSYMDNEPYSKDTDNYGLYPMDTVILSTMSIYQIVNQLPHYIDSGSTVMRYWDIRHMYLIIKRFEEYCEFYRLCKRNGGLKWVSVERDFYGSAVTPTLTAVNTLPSTGDTAYTLGDFVCLNENVELCNDFNKRFRKTGSTHRYELDFIDFFKKLHNGDYAGNVRIPFIEMEIPIYSDYEDIGLYTSEYEKWVPKKKYYLGDLVIYEDGLYELVKGYDGRTTGDTYYRGHFNDETLITEFDDAKNNHWKQVSVTAITVTAVTGLNESKLSILLPMRNTYDDDGNKLPFTYDSSNAEAGNYTNTYLQYTLKPKNIEIGEGGKILADMVTVIRTYDKNSTLLDTFTYSGWTKGSVATDDISSGMAYVDFEYVLHGEMTTDTAGTYVTGIDPTSGVRYKERYVASFDTINGKWEGRNKTFKYVKIGDMTLTDTNNNMVAWSHISFNPIEVSGTSTYRIFKDDSLHGVHGITENSDDLYVTRGTSAAMERHYIMMEISSFDDLEKYKNNYFGL